ncbi:MAG: cation:proton antiporter [Campylobacterales bacterium]
MENILTIITLSLLITLSPFIAKTLRFPVAVTEILLGMGASALGLMHGSEFLKIIAKVGILYLMFLAGLEVNLRHYVKMPRHIWQRMLLYFSLVYGLSTAVTLYLDLPKLYIVAFAIFSLGMIMALYREVGHKYPWLGLALSVDVMGELISISGLTILSASLNYGFGWEFAKAMGTLLLFLLGVALLFKIAKVLFWWYPELKKWIMPDADSKNQDIRFSMALFFIMIAMMLYLKLDVVLGAFLAGVFIATFFEHKEELPEKLSQFGFGFLVPIFFIYVGTTVPLASLIDREIIWHTLFIIAVLVGIRLIASFASFLSHLGWRQTLLLALADSMPLTFLVAVATLGVQAGAITQAAYYSFIIAAMIDGVVLMTLIKFIYPRITPKSVETTR